MSFGLASFVYLLLLLFEEAAWATEQVEFMLPPNRYVQYYCRAAPQRCRSAKSCSCRLARLRLGGLLDAMMVYLWLFTRNLWMTRRNMGFCVASNGF